MRGMSVHWKSNDANAMRSFLIAGVEDSRLNLGLCPQRAITG
jgi:hypothetical protein